MPTVPQYTTEDEGYFDFLVHDLGGQEVWPDWQEAGMNPHPKVELVDSTGAVKIILTSADGGGLVKNEDANHPYVYAEGLDLSDFALGQVIARVYASVNEVNLDPYPAEIHAFDIVADLDAYITAPDVIEDTGVQFKDLGKANGAELTALLNKWCLWIKNIIDTYCGQSWTNDTAPGTVKVVAMRIASGMVSQAVQKRKNKTVDVENFDFNVIQGEVFTQELKDLLDMFRAAGGDDAGFAVGLGVRSWADRQEDEDEE